MSGFLLVAVSIFIADWGDRVWDLLSFHIFRFIIFAGLWTIYDLLQFA